MGKRVEIGALAEAGEVPTDTFGRPSKRRLILGGMLEAVGSEGYERTSVRTVLERTGSYRQAFYDNFADKDDCYLQAYDDAVERIEATLRAAADAEEGWVGRLRAGLGAALDLLDAGPEVGRALVVEVHAAGPAALARRAAAMGRLTAFLDLARTEIDPRRAPPPIAAEGIVAGFNAVVHSRLAAGADGGFRDLLPDFMYFAVLPFFGVAAAEAEMHAVGA